MTTTMHPYAGEADLPAVTELLRVCEALDHPKNLPTQAELRSELLVSPPLDPEHDARVWQDTVGQVCAFAMVWLPHLYLAFFVHPQARGTAVESQIISWADERVQEIARERVEPVHLRVRPHEGDVNRIALLLRHGFMAEDWYALRLRRTLAEPVPEPQLPPGFTIRHLAGEQEVEAYVATHREAFGTTQMTVEERLAFMQDLAYLPELDLVAVAPDGTLAAFCVCGIDEQENATTGEKHGYTDPIGTRPAFRRMGLARALVLEGLRRLRSRGVATVEVATGSWNTAIPQLLQSVGFCHAYKVLAYCKEIQP